MKASSAPKRNDDTMGIAMKVNYKMIYCPKCGRGFRESQIPEPHRPSSIEGSTAPFCEYDPDHDEYEN